MTDQIEEIILQRFKIIQKIGSGAYGHVWKVIDNQNGKTYALKKNFDAFSNSSDAQRTYREIMFLKQLKSPYIVKLYDVIQATNDNDIYLVFQFVDVDLHSLCRSPSALTILQKKYILYQIAKSILYLHCAKLIHRDIKPSNVLVNKNCQIKLCDFGLIRSLEENKIKGDIMTDYIATRWYRAPQILFSSTNYCKAIDIWGYGCLMGQIIRGKPMFCGSSTQEQLELILSWTGFPTRKDLSELQQVVNKNTLSLLKPRKSINKRQFVPCQDSKFHSLLDQILQFSPYNRPSIHKILSHPYFHQFYQNDQQINKIIKETNKVTVPVDDNHRLNLKQYRQLIYCEIATNKSQVSIKQSSTKIITTPSTSVYREDKNQKKIRKGRINLTNPQQSFDASRAKTVKISQQKRSIKKGISLYSKKIKTQSLIRENESTPAYLSTEFSPQKHSLNLADKRMIEEIGCRKIKKAINIPANLSYYKDCHILGKTNKH